MQAVFSEDLHSESKAVEVTGCIQIVFLEIGIETARIELPVGRASDPFQKWTWINCYVWICQFGFEIFR